MTPRQIPAADSLVAQALESAAAKATQRLALPRVWTPPNQDRATAEMVHDFRNILGTVNGLAQLALLELSDGSPAAALVDEICGACRDAGDLCQQLLNRSTPALCDFEHLDLALIVREMATPLRACIPQKFTLELELAPAQVLAPSRGQLRRLVLNLVKNAAESLGGRPGSVRVSTGTLESPDVKPTPAAAALDGQIHSTPFLMVSDTGCGMSRSVRTRLLKQSFTTRSSGHGLGLASVRRIVEDCGGSLRISSEVGRGTAVTLLFPPTPAPASDIVIDPRHNMRTVQPEDSPKPTAIKSSNLDSATARIVRSAIRSEAHLTASRSYEERSR